LRQLLDLVIRSLRTAAVGNQQQSLHKEFLKISGFVRFDSTIGLFSVSLIDLGPGFAEIRQLTDSETATDPGRRKLEPEDGSNYSVSKTITTRPKDTR